MVIFRAMNRRDRFAGSAGSAGSEHRWLWAAALGAAAAVGLPALASALIRRSAQPPQAPRWGRSHRYAGPFGEITFQEIGAVGTPVLLLHSPGPGHDAEQWREAAELLALRHRVYVPDLPGWGRSEPPPEHRPGVYTEVIADFLSAVVREPAVVLAAGLSAAWALAVAALHPERVLALGLVAPRGLGGPIDGPGVQGELLRSLLPLPVCGDSILDLLTRRSALLRHLNRLYAAPERVDAALLDHCYRASHRPAARRALAAYWSGQLDPGGLPELPRDLPVWIAWGRAAVEPPVENADLWLRRLPDAALDVFDGAGGLPHAEVPARFCRSLEVFLNGFSG
jgi:pimeloyl-ACP methyl ester carboxylesterase